MPPPVQTIYPGTLENSYRRELQKLVAQNALRRLWAKDTSLWQGLRQPKEFVESNLRWLDLPEQVGPLMARVAARAAEIESAGFEDVVIIAMGGSNWAAETTLSLPAAKLGKRSFLLENVDPDSIRALEETVRLDRTLFIFASKSGKSIETHALLLYFLEKLRALGVPSAGRHFVALTEEGSYLAEMAREYGFVDTFFDPPGIQGRYSALIHFNFFLATLCRCDPKDLIARTQSMRAICGPSAAEGTNPALALGAFLTAGEIEGLNRLVLLGKKSLEPLTYRIGHVVGASTGKEGRGIIPVFGQFSYGTEILKRGCQVAMLKAAGENSPEITEKLTELRRAGVPAALIELNVPEDFAAELFKWEIATALTCAVLGVDPFDDPDTRESRATTVQILETITTEGQAPLATARVREGDLELYAEGETRQQISTLSMADALRTFLGLRKQDDYLALLPFVGLSGRVKEILHRLRDRLVAMLGVPVLVTSGPRYLHGLGQVYKGGPRKGLFLVLTADPVKDLAVPGAAYSFGQLQLALALGDFESLGQHHRPTIRLHSMGGMEQGLVQLETILNTALGKSRSVTR